MSITRKELEKLISVKPKIEKVATVSSDGKNLLLRIPKEIREMFSLERGDKVRFVVDDKGEINFEVIHDAEKEEERP